MFAAKNFQVSFLTEKPLVLTHRSGELSLSFVGWLWRCQRSFCLLVVSAALLGAADSAWLAFALSVSVGYGWCSGGLAELVERLGGC